MIRKVKLKNIKPNPFQTRKTQDRESIKSLAEEIESVGLWTGALRGRENNGEVELCFGHRRLEAVRELGWKEVDVDIVKLTDEEMALQGLIENLQREGLNDADRGDGIAGYIKLRNKSQITSADVIKDDLGRLLGLSRGRIDELLKISNFDEDVKEPIRQQKIAGKTAVAAMRIGGAKAVKAVAKKELGFRAMEAIGSKFANLPEETEAQKAVKDKVRERFARGEISTPDDVEMKVRQIKAQSIRKEKVPLDLIDVMRGWTERAYQWSKQLAEVAPYIDYIDQEPVVAKRWRSAVQELIEKLQKCV
jgi:ParB family chromosome partitioning protein